MRVTSRASGILVAAIGIVFGSTIDAQPAPRRIELPKASATHDEEFTAITSVRELRDGRVFATDGREQRLVVLDFAKGTATPIGRRGGGPNEYGMVTWVFPIGGDSSLMVDMIQRRWLLFDVDRIVETVPPDAPGVKATAAHWVQGADSRGNVLVRLMAELPTGVTDITPTDSIDIVLVERATGKEERVARIRPLPTRREVRRDGDRITFSSSMPTGPVSIAEEFAFFPDGALGIARLDPFRVDWRLPDGTWRLGAPLPVARIRVDRRERRAFHDRNRATYERQPPPGLPIPRVEPPDDSEFPEYLPPFPGQQGVVLAGPRGLLFIRRTKSADYPGLSYFVVDRESRLVGELFLAANETIVGASEANLYIGWKDEDDIQRLRRHPWPSTVSPVTPR